MAQEPKPTKEQEEQAKAKAWEYLLLKLEGKSLPSDAVCFPTGSQSIYISFTSEDILPGKHEYTCSVWGSYGVTLVGIDMY